MKLLPSIVFFFVSVIFTMGCSTKIHRNKSDSSLVIEIKDNDELFLSSTNSATVIRIKSTQQKGDTLVVDYQQGVFVKMKNTLNIDSKTNYLKCANRTFYISRNNGVIEKVMEKGR